MEKRGILCIRCDGLYLERFSGFLDNIKKEHQIENLKDFESLALISEAHPTVLLVTIRLQSEIQELVTVLTPLQAVLNSRRLIVIVVQGGLNEKQEKALFRAGCKEVLPDRADLRGLNAKIVRYLNIAEQNFSKHVETVQSKVVRGTATKMGDPSSADIVTMVEPVAISHDYWVINAKRPAQRNMGRWIISAIGPSPAIGSWVTNEERSRIYVFKVHSAMNQDFQSTEGSWVFHGSKPEFSFELGRWSFVGSDPKLEWVSSSGAVIAVRFWHNPETKKLILTANSENTIRWLPKIEATFDRDYRFREETLAHTDDFRHTADTPKEMELKLGALVKDIPSDVVNFLKTAKTQFAAKPQMFSKLEEKKKINRFFEVAGEFQDRGILWLGGRIFLSDLRVHNVDLEKGVAEVIMVPPVLDPLGLIDEGLSGHVDNRVFVNIKLLETSLFFYVSRTDITCNEGVLSVPIPASAYEVQRRGGARLSNSPRIPGLELTKIPPTAKGDWKVIDISPGGIGLETNSDSFSFSKERPFKIELKVQDTVLNLICSVRWLKPDELSSKLRIGAQFEHLSGGAQEMLELYIMEKHLDRIRQSSRE